MSASSTTLAYKPTFTVAPINGYEFHALSRKRVAKAEKKERSLRKSRTCILYIQEVALAMARGTGLEPVSIESKSIVANQLD